jgi:hypothetical protein
LFKLREQCGTGFEDLVELGFDTPEKIQAQFLTEGYAERATGILEGFNQYLQQNDDNAVVVEASSSDVLLGLLLDTHTEQVLEKHPMGRGYGRPPRIASFATRFKSMRQAEEDVVVEEVGGD